MKSNRIKSGFTLLELMIVLLLVSILASFIAPLVSLSSARTIVLDQAESIRFELQQLVSRSWIERRSFQVAYTASGEWYLYSLEDGNWEQESVLFTTQSTIYLKSYSKELNDYSAKVTNSRVAFFSSGEYTPVVITLNQDDASVTIKGDGLNEFVIQ